MSKTDEFGGDTAAVAAASMVLDDGGGSTPIGDDLHLCQPRKSSVQSPFLPPG